MTGHQDNPVTGVTLMKDVTTAVDIKTLVLGCGVKPENVRTVDSYDLKATAAVVKEAYEAEDLFVVIVRQPCALLKSVIAHRKGQHCRVNADKCGHAAATSYGACVPQQYAGHPTRAANRLQAPQAAAGEAYGLGPQAR